MNFSNIKALGPWFAEARFTWLTLILVTFALTFAFRTGTTEPTIRLTGLALQIFGIATVIWGISETRALFGHTSLLCGTKSWLMRFPLRTKKVVVGITGVSVGTATGLVSAIVTHGSIGEPTIENRLAALEKNIATIHERITNIEQKTTTDLGRLRDSLSSESSMRTSEDDSIRKKLEATGTGGVHISAIGAALLFVGVILSTAAPEILTALS